MKLLAEKEKESVSEFLSVILMIRRRVFQSRGVFFSFTSEKNEDPFPGILSFTTGSTLLLPVPGLCASLFIPRCSGHTITMPTGFLVNLHLIINLLKHTNPEINLGKKILTILPCKSHEEQEFYYSGAETTNIRSSKLPLRVLQDKAAHYLLS